LIGAVLYAKDLGRLVEFYSSVAGIEPQALEEGFAVLGPKPSQFVIVRHSRSKAFMAPTELCRTVSRMCDVFDTEHELNWRIFARFRGRNDVNCLCDALWEFEGVKVCDGP
jgi:hypothetical protein